MWPSFGLKSVLPPEMDGRAHRRGGSGGQLQEAAPPPLIPERSKQHQHPYSSHRPTRSASSSTATLTTLPPLPESPGGPHSALVSAGISASVSVSSLGAVSVDRRPSAGNLRTSFRGLASMQEHPYQQQQQQQNTQQGTIRAVTPEPREGRAAPQDGRFVSDTSMLSNAGNPNNTPATGPLAAPARPFGPVNFQSSPRTIPEGGGRRQGRVFNDAFPDPFDTSVGGAPPSPPPRPSSARPRTRTMDGPPVFRPHAATLPSSERLRVGSFSLAEDLRGPLLQPPEPAEATPTATPTIATPAGRLPQALSESSLVHHGRPPPISLSASPAGLRDRDRDRDKKSAGRRLIKRVASRPTSPLVSPPPSVDSLPLPIPTSNANNVLLLMRNLCGRMRGEIEYRGDSDGPWYSGIGYIEGEKGSLMFDSGENGPFHIAIVPDLRGCRILPVDRADRPGDTCLEIGDVLQGSEIMLRPLVAEEFDLWLAALLSWQQLRPGGSGGPAGTPKLERERPELKRRGSSTRSSVATTATAGSGAGGGSCGPAKPEAAIIKVGKVKLWDKGYASSPRPIVRRPSARDLRAVATPAQTTWRRVSCILQDSGEFKLMTENDVTILSVIELSQLGRCAVQQLDKSVLDEDFCLAIFPIYASTATQLSIFRPVYIALDSRVLFEVWYVLLRAFTVPDLYAIEPAASPGVGSLGDQLIEITNLDEDYNGCEVFRVEKTINLRLTEAKMRDGPEWTPVLEQQQQQQQQTPQQQQHKKSSKNQDHKSHDHHRHKHHDNQNCSSCNGQDEDPVVGNYLAEVILDGEVRARTTTKPETRNPFWREDCEFTDLPAALPFLSVVLKRQEGNLESLSHQLQASLGLPKTGNLAEVMCGSVDIPLHQLEQGRDHEQWFQIYDARQQSIGSMLARVHHEELVVLPSREYQPLSELLHKYNSGLTALISDALPGHLRRVAEIFLNIFQVSGGAAEWLMALVEDEIDGIANSGSQATTMKKMRFNGRLQSADSSSSSAAPSEPALPVTTAAAAGTSGSDVTVAPGVGGDAGATPNTGASAGTAAPSPTLNTAMGSPDTVAAGAGAGAGAAAAARPIPRGQQHNTQLGEHQHGRDQLVRDIGRSLAGEANLLFRGNSLLTQALEFHMRRLGSEYLGETLAEKIFEINEVNPNCEVDPGRVQPGEDIQQHWSQLMRFTGEVWACIADSATKFPPQLRLILKYIRAVAEDRYGDFLRTVVYTSVSGFLFLRFICPAILNPKLFGLLRDHPRPRAQRTLTLIAKGLQALANLSAIGKKETWMDPMNKFLNSHRQAVKDFIDAICDIPTERHNITLPASYSTPITILGRLSPIAREGFPSLPYLIDHPRNFAALVRLWVENHAGADDAGRDITSGSTGGGAQPLDGDLLEFHRACLSLSRRAGECAAQVEALRAAAAADDESEAAMQLGGADDPAYTDHTDAISVSYAGSTVWTGTESDQQSTLIHAPSSFSSSRPPGSSGSEMDDHLTVGPKSGVRGRWGRQTSGGSEASAGSGSTQSGGGGTIRGLRNGKHARKFLSGLLIKKGRTGSPDCSPAARDREKDGGDARDNKEKVKDKDRNKEGGNQDRDRDISFGGKMSKGLGFAESWGSGGSGGSGGGDMGGRRH